MSGDKTSNIYDVFLSEVDKFVSAKLSSYTPSGSASQKVIHDPVWGSINYFKWEMEVIDSPLLQRLRNINQVGLAGLTYPTARHSRFEHSLGTVAVSSKMVENIMSKNERRSRSEDKSYAVSREDLYIVRMAALLHDVGHCFYSHLSESLYGIMDEFIELIDFFQKNKKKAKPHEIFSYLVINTPSFIKFFKQTSYPMDHRDHKSYVTLMQCIGNMIIGQNNARIRDDGKKETFSFLTSLINGDFDADKLDYIKRDSYNAGLTLSYDMDRLLYKIDVIDVPTSYGCDYRLVIEMTGVTAIEEITFSKIMLFSYIYYHQKVLITEQVVKDATYGLICNGLLQHPWDFLYYTDADLERFSYNDTVPFEGLSDKKLSLFFMRIKNRDLPKRCFEINRKIMKIGEKALETEKDTLISECIATIEQEVDITKKQQALLQFASSFKEKIADEQTLAFQHFELLAKKFYDMKYQKYLEKRYEFYLKLCEKYSEQGRSDECDKFDIFDIYIVIPKPVNFNASDASYVKYNNKHLEKLDAFMRLKDWGEAFNANKWRAFVYVGENIDTDIAYEVAHEYFKQNIDDIDFINPHAFIKGLTIRGMVSE